VRTVLTLPGVVIGVGTVIAIGAIANGLNSNVVGQLDLSIADPSTSPLRAVAILPLSDFHMLSRAGGPK